MNIRKDVPLGDYSTMRLGGSAAYFTEVEDKNDLLAAVDWASLHNLPIIMVGQGSNIIWKDEGFPGLLVVNQFLGYSDAADDGTHIVTIGAGEIWDSVVERTVQAGLTGIEGLSLIPGTAGATPIQNVGAYGQEISQTLVRLEAYDLQTSAFVTIQAKDCAFSYRASTFNTTDRGRYLITSITLHLTAGNPQPPYYAALQKYLAENGATSVTPRVMRDSVIAIRSSKLPDPNVVANNGSFFGNALISTEKLTTLQATYPDMPHWDTSNPDEHKIPAAWLLERAGFKDIHDSATGMATWPTQTLVLVNEHARSTADLLAFKKKIVDAVHTKFDITLKQEPELLPTD